MSYDPVIRFRREAHTAYSRHLTARLYRLWRYFSSDPATEDGHGAADVLVLPLAGLAFSLWLLGAVPGASDAVAAVCATACMP